MIRLAVKEDLPRILEIYASARRFMREQGNPNQWKEGYPAPSVLEEDMERGFLYVDEWEGTPYGVFFLKEGPDPTYSRIDGEGWRQDTPYGVIHKVASDGTRKGFLHTLMTFARERFSQLRIDTHADNIPMQNALAKEGFSHRGTIYLANGDPRLAYDWLGMEKVLVIGCPGGGKSTFARALRDKTNLPLYSLDMIWHKQDKTTVTREEFDTRLEELLRLPRFLIEGNYSRTLERRLEACDTVFLLDYPVEVCLAGVESRIGKKREDMPWVETEFDPEFREFILRFAAERLPHIYKCLEDAKGKRVVIFRSREEAASFLETL